MMGFRISVILMVCLFSSGLTAANAAPPKTHPLLLFSPENNCALRYPPAAIRANEKGKVGVTIVIDETGKPTNVSIAQSSGFADLDQATVDCVMRAWRFVPARSRNGDVPSTEHFSFFWNPENRDNIPTPLGNTFHPCDQASASSSIQKDGGKITIVSYRVTSSGQVEDAFASEGSGDPNFDAMAVQCVSQIKYAPGTIAGQPADWPWGTSISWIEHAGLVDAEGAGKWHVCADEFYPAAAKAAHIEGSASISFHIVAPGVVTGVHIDQSSGNSEFDQAAITCAGKWTYPGPNFHAPTANFKQVAKIFWRSGHVFVLEYSQLPCAENAPIPFCRK